MDAFQTALNAAQPYPDWDTSKEPWEGEAGEWYRTNRAIFHDTTRNGTIVMSAAVEQYEVLGQTPPPPVIDVYVAAESLSVPYTWQEVMSMGKGLIQASALMQRLLVEAGDHK